MRSWGLRMIAQVSNRHVAWVRAPHSVWYSKRASSGEVTICQCCAICAQTTCIFHPMNAHSGAALEAEGLGQLQQWADVFRLCQVRRGRCVFGRGGCQSFATCVFECNCQSVGCCLLAGATSSAFVTAADSHILARRLLAGQLCI